MYERRRRDRDDLEAAFEELEWELETGWTEAGWGDGLDEEDFDLLDGFDGETAPAHAFKDCSAAQSAMIRDAAGRAKSAVAWAEKYVADAHGRPQKMSPTVRRLLNEHFHTTDRTALRDILTRLMKIRQALQKGVRFECEKQCTQSTQGYARTSQLFGGSGPVHLCFDSRPGHSDFAGLVPDEQEILVIHEVAHRHLGIGENGIAEKSAGYAKMTARQALGNAENYAAFAVRMNQARPAFIR